MDKLSSKFIFIFNSTVIIVFNSLDFIALNFKGDQFELI